MKSLAISCKAFQENQECSCNKVSIAPLELASRASGSGARMVISLASFWESNSLLIIVEAHSKWLDVVRVSLFASQKTIQALRRSFLMQQIHVVSRAMA